jgi:2-amino-4-hydroxy-6-hydroxymethyldihydropteridine diphosphokinase
LIALGANLPFGELAGVDLLQAALVLLRTRGLVARAVSRFWRTPPWPPGSVQPAYVNACAELQVESTSPQALWRELTATELQFGRVRGARNAPRTMDLDLIGFDDLILEGPDLVLPHPRAHERAFVMYPLAEIAPDWVHPVLGRTAAEIAAGLAAEAEGMVEISP